MTYLTGEQVGLLLKPIHPKRVRVRDGMSHVEGYDIRAELTRVFGFGRWSSEVLEQTVLCERETRTKIYTDKKTGEQKGGHPAWYVVYRSRIRLKVHAPDGTLITFHDGTHVGASTHPDFGEAHGNALTNSETYALRRAAINLGDQFGLSLYNKGSLEAIVRWTLVRPEQAEQPGTTDTDDVPQVSAEDTGSPAGEEESAGETFENAAPAGPQEQRQQEPESDLWATPPVTDEKWLAATLKVVPQIGREACRKLWRETSEKQHSGELADADARAVLALIKARVEYLGLPADWAAKVDELNSPEDADPVLAEVFRMLGDGTMKPELARRIEFVITARFPQPGSESAVAA